jgi:hypothetical protein
MSRQSEKKDRELQALRGIAGQLRNLSANNNNRGTETEREPNTGIAKFIRTYKPSGGFVLWFFGVGLSAALNCLSTDPHILFVTWFAFTCWIIWIFFHKGWVYTICVFLFCLVLLYPCEKLIAKKQADSVTLIPQPDFIEGTQFTYKQLEQAFPFGYAVYFYAEKTQMSYDVFTNGMFDWNTDWRSIQIEPNFANGTVSLKIPVVNANNESDNQHFRNFTINPTIAMKTGEITPIDYIHPSNGPIPFVLVLSDDQRNPVFAVGLRIETDEEYRKQHGH